MVTYPGADCGSDHNLLAAKVRCKLKNVPKNKSKPKFDLERIDNKFTITLKNRFDSLTDLPDDPEQMWTSIKESMLHVAEQCVPKIQRKIENKWLSDGALSIAKRRREAKANGNRDEFRRLNADFQRQARIDKEAEVSKICKRIEEDNKVGRTRDLFKEIKGLVGGSNRRCATIRSVGGGYLSEENEVKQRWKEYTEHLYEKDPHLSDSFTRVFEYDEEPEILKSEISWALQQLANRKSAGCDGLSAELLKAGGRTVIDSMWQLCNQIWRQKKWPKDWKTSILIPVHKKGDVKDCSNYRTIALLPHASKVMLKIL